VETYRVIRALKRRLEDTRELRRQEARDLFFAACLLEMSKRRFDPPVGFVERAVDLVPRYAPLLSKAISPICEEIRRDPLTLGWAYQIWNEDQRALSTWAVSRRGDGLSAQASISAATQLFTEEYMTRFLIRSVLGSESSQVCELFDPACGVGHFLVEGIRNVGERSRSPKAVADFVSERLFGVDIDPYAVELCRVILWLEVARHAPEASHCIWRVLQSAIRALPSEIGSLDRSSCDPLLNRSYRCIATNPPYLGRRKLTQGMRAFLDQQYPDAAADLCAAFLQRCIELLAPSGKLALVTLDKWLRLRTYAAVRNGGTSFPGLYHALSIDTLCELGDRAFRRELGLHDGVRILLTVARRQPASEDHRLNILDATGCRGPMEKAAALEEFAVRGSSPLVRSLPQRDLRQRESWEAFERWRLPRSLQDSGRSVRDVAEVVVGLQTNDDRRFVRFHWEVVPDPRRWRVHSKGGGYGRWFGLNRYLLDWTTGRPEFERNPRCGVGVESHFERSGWTYTWFANGCLGLRRKEHGWSFGRAASSGFFCEDDRVVAFLNSRFGSLGARRVGGKIQLPEGIVRKLPIPACLESINPKLVSAAVEIKKALMSNEPTDAWFRPDIRLSPQVLLSLEVVLLLLEEELEQQVERSVQCSTTELDEIGSLLGVPVARTPCSDFGRRAVDPLWSLVPEEFRRVREFISLPSASGTITSAQEDDVLSGLMQRPQRGSPQSSLPSDTRLEFVCHRSRLHPLDAYHVILKTWTSNLVFSRAFLMPYITDEILRGVAETLGHRWWSEGSPVGQFQSRGVVSVDVVLERVRARVLAGADAFGRFSVEEVLGSQIGTWLGESFLAWQERRLFRRPLAIGASRKSGRIQGFRHAWDVEGMSSQDFAKL
jgi:hypothetical protein